MACTPFLPGVQTSTEYRLLTSPVPTRVINVANKMYLQPRRSVVVRRPSFLIVAKQWPPKHDRLQDACRFRAKRSGTGVGARLRREVLRRAAERVRLAAGSELLRKAKVGDLEVALRVDQQVLGLEVAARAMVDVSNEHIGWAQSKHRLFMTSHSPAASDGRDSGHREPLASFSLPR
jgi:hypothetical protein